MQTRYSKKKKMEEEKPHNLRSKDKASEEGDKVENVLHPKKRAKKISSETGCVYSKNLIQTKNNNKTLLKNSDRKTINMEPTNNPAPQKEQPSSSSNFPDIGFNAFLMNPWKQGANYKNILAELKSEDDTRVLQAVMELSSQLSLAQENTLASFAVDAFIPVLLECIQKEFFPDIMLYATMSLTQIMDIFPSTCNNVVSHEGVRILSEKMQNLDYIDVAECAIKAIEKVSLENPYAVISSGALSIMLNLIDFFEMSTQKIFRNILVNISKYHITNEADFKNFMAPVLPALANLLRYEDQSEMSKAMLESVSSSFVRICEGVPPMFDQITKYEKICEIIDIISNSGILECVFKILSISMNGDMKHITLPAKIVINLLKIVSCCCKYSNQVRQDCINFGIFNIVNLVLPAEKEHNSESANLDENTNRLIQEAINLMNCILPYKFVDSAEKEKLSPYRVALETEAWNFMSTDKRLVMFMAEVLLPKIFNIYETNVSQTMRVSSLQAIDRILNLFDVEMLKSYINPELMSKFLYTVISSENNSMLKIGLEIMQILVDKCAYQFYVSLMRDGVISLVEKIAVKEEEPIVAEEKKEGEENASLVKNMAQESASKGNKLRKFASGGEAKTTRSKTKALATAASSAATTSKPTSKAKETEPHFTKPQIKEISAKFMTSKQAFLIKQSETSQSSTQSSAQSAADQLKQHISTISTELYKKYINDEKFIAEVKENVTKLHSEFDPFDIVSKLNKTACTILKEAKDIHASVDDIRKLIESIGQLFISNGNLTTYEFKESGLADAMYKYLCVLPSMLPSTTGIPEESKSGAPMLRRESTMIPSEEESMCMIRRQTIFVNVMLKMHISEHSVMMSLIQVLENTLTRYETSLVGVASTSNDFNGPIHALKSLTRRVKFQLIYAPNEDFEERNMATSEKVVEESESSINKKLGKTKKRSAKDLIDIDKLPRKNSLLEESEMHGEEYNRRHHIYTDLNSVVISVEQCATFDVIDDFLRNKICKQEHVQYFKNPSGYKKDFMKEARSMIENARNLFKESSSSSNSSNATGMNDPKNINPFTDFQSFISEQIFANKSISEQEKHKWLQELEIQKLTEGDDPLNDEEEDDEEEENEGPKIMSIDSAPNKVPVDQLPEFVKNSSSEGKVGGATSSKTNISAAQDSEKKGEINTRKKSSENDTRIEFLFKYNGLVVKPRTSIFQLLKKFMEQQQLSQGDNSGSNTLHFKMLEKRKFEHGKTEELKEGEMYETELGSAKSNNMLDASYLVSDILFNEINVSLAKENDNYPIIKLLKFIRYILQNYISLVSCTPFRRFDENESLLPIEQLISAIKDGIFINKKINSYALRQLHDPHSIIGNMIPEESLQITHSCPFLFPFYTRHLYFKLTSFDMNRTIFFLTQELKQKIGELPEESKIAKVSRQKVRISRKNFLENAAKAMKSFASSKSFLEFEYYDEEGTGLGPTLEFYTLSAEEIKNVKSLWRFTSDNSLFPNALKETEGLSVKKIKKLYKFAGSVTAKSIADDRLIDLPFSPVFWDLVFSKKLTLKDVSRVDAELGKFLQDLYQVVQKKITIESNPMLSPEQKERQINTLTIKGCSIEDLSIYFNLPGDAELELKVGGKEIQVTIHNVEEYLSLIVYNLFYKTVHIQVKSFIKGFNRVFPVECLKCFTSDEIEDLVCGGLREEWSKEALLEHVIPAHGYSVNSLPYIYFITYMSQLEQAQRKEFLRFVTGSPRLPIGGIKSLHPKLTVVYRKPTNMYDVPDHTLPTVMTCLNFVKLPEYSSMDILIEKLKYACKEGQKSFTMS